MQIEPRTLKGFRDSSPSVQKIRNKIWQTARKVAEDSGFEEIATPALEYAEILISHAGGETEKQTYLFKDHGERNVGLRFDLTIPFARYIAENHGRLTFPLRRLQIGEVWRGENTQKGRYREFCQCDLDIVGSDTEASDIEVISNLAKILSALNFGGVTFHINSRPVLSGMLKSFYGEHFEPVKEPQALIALDKLGKLPEEKVAKLLEDIFGIPSGNFIQQLSKADVNSLRTLQTEVSNVHFERLLNTFELLEKFFKFPNISYQLNFTIARGLGYYDGIVFETTMASQSNFGSICSGGRYNNLVSRFSKENIPGVGGSIGVDRLVAFLEDVPQVQVHAKTRILIAYTHGSVLDYACEILSELKNLQIVSELGLQSKISQQFRHADRLKIPYVITVGPDEKTARTFSFKNMTTQSEQKNISLSEILTITKSL